MDVIELSVFDCDIRVECLDRQATSLLNSNYGWFKRAVEEPQIRYRITRQGTAEGHLIARNGAYPELARDDGDFLHMFLKDMNNENQKIHSPLFFFFLYAAVLELDGRALALVAPAGYGKSTAAWGLLHHGFKYVSDELAPVDPSVMQ